MPLQLQKARSHHHIQTSYLLNVSPTTMIGCDDGLLTTSLHLLLIKMYSPGTVTNPPAPVPIYWHTVKEQLGNKVVRDVVLKKMPMGELSKWCNCMVITPKLNAEQLICLCSTDFARHNHLSSKPKQYHKWL